MANGPFGNPLTTGIALTFDVDMTPYDNMLKRNAAKAAEKAKADKDLLDKYNEYAKNITVDFDKIDYRLHDKARAKYAETLAELNKAVMNKDLHAANMLMMDSKQFNSNLIQRTSDLNEIFNQDPTKVYYDPEIEKIWKDRSIPNDDKRIVEIISKYGSQDELIGSFKKAPSRRNLKTDVDNLLKGAKRRLQPGDKPTMYLPTGEAVYEPKYTNKDEVRNQVIMDYTSPQNIGSTIYMLMEDYGMSPSELQGKDIPETQEKLTAAIDRVFDPIWSSIESEQFKSRPPKEEGKGYMGGYGKTDEYSYEFVDQPRAIYGNRPETQTGGRGGQELLVDVDNSMVFQNVGKTAKKFAINIPAGSFEIGSEGTEYTPIKSTQKGLNDAIALASYSDKDGKLWYKVASKAEIEQLGMYEKILEDSRGEESIDYTSLSRYAKTYLIPSNAEIDSQFWQGVGIDKKERERIIKDLKGGGSMSGTQSSESSEVSNPFE